MKRLLSMLLAVAMVLSLCVNVFAVKETDYNNGADEEVLRINGSETEFKIVVFDSDQDSANTTFNKVNKMTENEMRRMGLTLTTAERADGVGYYSVYLNARLIWSGQDASRRLSAGGLVLAVHPDAASGKNPYPSQAKMKDLLITDTAVTDVLTNYVLGSNMENEENKGIYKLRLALSYGTETPKTDAKGNYYHDFYIGLQGMKGKPGDQFKVDLLPYIASADGGNMVRFVASGMSAGSVYGETKVQGGTVYIPTDNRRITFYGNGGSPNLIDVTVERGSSTTTKGRSDFSRSGYLLTGWEESAEAANQKSAAYASQGDSVTTTYGLGQSITPSGDMNLYAVWRKIHKITLHPNGGTGNQSPNPIEVLDGNYLTLPSPYTRGNRFDFDGWNENQAEANKSNTQVFNGVDLVKGARFKPTRDMTLYAVWTEKFDIYFNWNGGINGPADMLLRPTRTDQYDRNPYIVLPNGKPTCAPLYSSYLDKDVPVAFIGWTENAYTTPLERNAALPSYYPAGYVHFAMPKKNVTLHALWGFDVNNNGTADVLERHDFTLTYHANTTDGLGTGAPGSLSGLLGGEPVVLSLQEPTHPNANYPGVHRMVEFYGWTATSNVTSKIYDLDLETVPGMIYNPGDVYIMPNDSAHLFAVWAYGPAVIPLLTLSYDLNGGSAMPRPEVKDVALGSKVVTPTAAAYNIRRIDPATGKEYKLVGWSATKLDPVKADEKAKIDALVAAEDFAKAGEEYIVKDMTKNVLYAVWAEDNLPAPVDSGDNPIDIPDYEKIVINFKVVGGRWTAENADTRTITLDGRTGTARIRTQDISATTASTITRSRGYQLPGIWSVDKIGAPVTPNATYDYRLSEKEYTYTYTLGTKGTTYIYLNGDDAFEHIDLDPSDPRNPIVPMLEGTIYDDDGDAYIITEIGAPDDDNVITVVAYPDDDRNGIPDRFQRDITFKIVNGYWSGTDSADKTVSVPVKSGDRYVMGSNGIPLGSGVYTVPSTANAAPRSAMYESSGTWNAAPSGTVTGASPRTQTFTFTFAPRVFSDEDGSGIPDFFERRVIFRIVGGTWDGTDSADKTVVAAIMNNGRFEMGPGGIPLGSGTYTVPDVSLARPLSAAYESYGAWDALPTGIVTGYSEQTQTFIYTFAEKAEFVVSYDANGGAGDMLPSYVARGSSVTVAENGFDAPSGKRFKEWNTAPDGSGDSYQPGEAFAPAADTVLYAVWEDVPPRLDVVKILRWVGMEGISTGEPTSFGYDSNMVSRSVRVTLSGLPASASDAEVQRIQGMLDNAKYERYTRNGFEVISMDELTKYIDRPRAEAADGEITAVFTSRAPGVIRLTFENGYEFVIVTPGDVDLDGEMSSNDWATVMRWCMEAPASWDVTDLPGITVNGRVYDLWALLADMNSTEVIAERREAIDANDWGIMLHLVMEAWKN